MSIINRICSQKIVELKCEGMMIGGPGKIVEIDEVHIAVRKYMKGSELVSEHFWVFGMIEVEGGWIEFESKLCTSGLSKVRKPKSSTKPTNFSPRLQR